jgi:hypothetical protein
MYQGAVSKLWDLKNSIVEPLLLCGNRPCVEFLVACLGLSIWWRGGQGSGRLAPRPQALPVPAATLVLHAKRERQGAPPLACIAANKQILVLVVAGTYPPPRRWSSGTL